MKKLIISLLLAACVAHAENQWASYPGRLRGRILQIVEDGAPIADGVFDTGERDASANEKFIFGTFFLRGIKGQFADDKINVIATPDGTYDYITALGASAHVRAFRLTVE